MIHRAGRPIHDRDWSREEKFGAGAPTIPSLQSRQSRPAVVCAAWLKDELKELEPTHDADDKAEPRRGDALLPLVHFDFGTSAECAIAAAGTFMS
jgi:hypothetical protein